MKTIQSTVGKGCTNRRADVITVQELLNQVPPAEAAPRPLLEVDGLCGPLTTNAIGKFQLKHFDWPGTDSRVEPGRQTIIKLNSFSIVPPTPIEKPRRSTKFFIQPVRTGPSFLKQWDENDWFFRVIDAGDAKQSAVYFFTIFYRGGAKGGPKGPTNKGIRIPRADEFRGNRVICTTAPYEMLVTEFACYAHYTSYLTFRADPTRPESYKTHLTLELIPPDRISPVNMKSVKTVYPDVHVAQMARSMFANRPARWRRDGWWRKGVPKSSDRCGEGSSLWPMSVG